MPRRVQAPRYHDFTSGFRQPDELRGHAPDDLTFAAITRLTDVGDRTFLVEWGKEMTAQYWWLIVKRLEPKKSQWVPVLTLTPRILCVFDGRGTNASVQHAKTIGRLHPSAYFRHTMIGYKNPRAHPNGFFFDGVVKRLIQPNEFTAWDMKRIAKP